MKLYGLMVAQNEADVIADTLLALRRLNVFETIFFYDLGSEDDTLARAMQFTDLLHEPRSLDRVYTSELRFELLAAHREYFRQGDWLSVVDADEVYGQDPRPLIALAEHESATTISTYQCEFMLTDRDLETIDDEDMTRPIWDRRKSYLIQWSEDRFFKFVSGDGILSHRKPCSARLMNRHYQYRTPEQIEMRIRTRLSNRTKARYVSATQKWPQIFSTKWSDYVVPHRVLHHDDGCELKLGLPDGVQWRDYYSKNPFSTVFPQVAVALARTRGQAVDTPSAVRPDRGTTFGIVRDDYRAQLVRELRDHVAAGHATEGAHTAVVLGRHVLRWPRVTLLPYLRCLVQRAGAEVRGQCVNLWRYLTGQPTGSLRACPNPIVRPQLSWQGASTISWKTSCQAVEVHVGMPDGQLVAVANADGQVDTGPWVADSTVFYLQDVSGGRPLTPEHTLAVVTVRLVHAAYVELS